MRILKERRLILAGILCVTSGLLLNAFAVDSSAGTQDVRSLDRRISSLEQRLYYIETSISQLQQSSISQRATASPASNRDAEINQLQAEIRTLQLRLGEVECGLIKLDERTTASAAREGRGNSGKTADQCRLNSATPVRLSNRP